MRPTERVKASEVGKPKAKKSDLLEAEISILEAIGEEFVPLLKNLGGKKSARERLTQTVDYKGFRDLNKHRGAVVYFASEPSEEVKWLLSEQNIEVAVNPAVTTSPADQVRNLGNLEKARNGLSFVDRVAMAQDRL